MIKPLHFLDGLRLPFRGGCIVEREAHPKQVRADESLLFIFNQRGRRVVEISCDKIRRYPVDLCGRSGSADRTFELFPT